jgi:hypothetical protein
MLWTMEIIQLTIENYATYGEKYADNIRNYAATVGNCVAVLPRNCFLKLQMYIFHC